MSSSFLYKEEDTEARKGGGAFPPCSPSEDATATDEYYGHVEPTICGYPG